METRKQSKTRDGLPAETLSRGGAKDLRSIREQVAQHLLDYPSNMQRCIREQLAIQQNILGDPALLDGPNYRRISSRTLQRMFVEYDERFFLGQTQRLVEFRQGSLDFRLSKRMTRTGGKTTRRRGSCEVMKSPCHPTCFFKPSRLQILVRNSCLAFGAEIDSKRHRGSSSMRCCICLRCCFGCTPVVLSLDSKEWRGGCLVIHSPPTSCRHVVRWPRPSLGWQLASG